MWLTAFKRCCQIQLRRHAKETESLKTIRVGLHTNRAAAHLMLGRPLPAAEDCCAALRLDSAHSKAQAGACTRPLFGST